jgi:predicted transposase YbfD/YdcC
MNAIEALAQLAQEIEDPRVARTRYHSLTDVLVIALLSSMAEGTGWEDMALYGSAHEQWLRQFLSLPNGIPGKDTFRRVISRIDPDALCAWMTQWMQTLADTAPGRLIPIDGKVLRHSFDHANQKSALHLVSAWAKDNQLTLGQVAVDEKSNEITAIPKLLEMIDIAGAVVSIDAMGCQTAIAEQIVEGKGDYVLAVKDNQPTLAQNCRETFSAYHEDPESYPEATMHVEQEEKKAHGRQEERTCIVIPLPEESAIKGQWKGAKALVQAMTFRDLGNGKRTDEVRYYVTSLTLCATMLAAYIRGHWSIENSLHWVMDVTFREDESRIHKDHGAANVGCLRRMAAGILRQENRRQLAKRGESKRKLSMRQKRLLAAWDKDYMLEVLAASRD